MCQVEHYIPVAQTRPKQPHIWLLFLKAGCKRAVLGRTILSNEKGHRHQLRRNERTGQSSHLQRWPQIFRSDPPEIVRSIWFLAEISGILAEWKAPSCVNIILLGKHE